VSSCNAVITLQARITRKIGLISDRNKTGPVTYTGSSTMGNAWPPPGVKAASA